MTDEQKLEGQFLIANFLTGPVNFAYGLSWDVILMPTIRAIGKIPTRRRPQLSQLKQNITKAFNFKNDYQPEPVFEAIVAFLKVYLPLKQS